MNNEAMKEVLNDLFSHLERLETQTEAILQFLKEKKRVSDKQLAPYLEQAGNASSVRWRAARVRIDYLLSPEHPEEELKLGKPPELQETPSESKRTESVDKTRSVDKTKSVDKEDKRTESGDTGLGDKEKSAPADAIQTRPVDGKEDKKADKSEEKSESEQGNKEQAAQDRGEQKSDSDDFQHPTEVTAPLAEQEGPEPAAQLNSKEKKSDQEAA
jgi:hypothetical protein